jgi:beta-lactamase class A
MVDKMNEELVEQLKNMEGKVSFIYKDLSSREMISYQEDMKMKAASIIKIPIMVEVFRQIESGRLNKHQTYCLKEEDKRPSCGALNMMHAGVELTILDLCNLMIILSDNTATNILIGLMGMEQINHSMKDLGLHVTKVNRLLFDREASAKGIENYVSASEIAGLLEKMYQGTLVSKEASAKMLDILKQQRLNGKIPFHFVEKIEVAHKTGEDDGITHDVGIVYGKSPFLVCFLGNEVDVPAFERFMQDATLKLLQYTEENKI